MKAADVPAGPLLLDTDVFSWITWSRGPYQDFEPLIQDHLLLLSFATVGELRAGAVKAKWGESRRILLENTIRHHYVVLPGTDAVSTEFGKIYARFGGREGVNDMWIAASALAQTPSPPIVTGNLSDFQSMATEFDLKIIHPDI